MHVQPFYVPPMISIPFLGITDMRSPRKPIEMILVVASMNVGRSGQMSRVLQWIFLLVESSWRNVSQCRSRNQIPIDTRIFAQYVVGEIATPSMTQWKTVFIKKTNKYGPLPQARTCYAVGRRLAFSIPHLGARDDQCFEDRGF